MPNWPVLGLAVAGMLLTGYLAASSWLGAQLAYCEVGSSCEVVQGSRWGIFLGLPMAFWGLLAYGALALIALRERNAARHWKWSWTLALAALGVSAYLTWVSFFVIEAACIYCLVSLGLLAAIFAVIAFQRPAGLPDFSWPSWAGQTGVLVLAMLAGLHFHYSGGFDPTAGPEDPYLKALTIHLADTGAVFYGAYW